MAIAETSIKSTETLKTIRMLSLSDSAYQPPLQGHSTRPFAGASPRKSFAD